MTPWMVVSCLAVVVACPRCPCAQPPVKQGEPQVKVTVVAILASERCKCIDPRLKEIAAELKKADPTLTGFSLVSMTQMSLPAGEKGTFACVEGAIVEVVIRQCMDKNDQVCLAVKAPLQNEIVYRTVCGKFLPIVTRFQCQEQVPPMLVAKALCQAMSSSPVGRVQALDTLMDGRSRARLIVAIRVQPCLGK